MNWLRFYFRWDRRIDRSGFLGGLFVTGFVSVMIAFGAVMGVSLATKLMHAATGAAGYPGAPFLTYLIVYYLLTALTSASLAARRLHDLGRSVKWIIPWLIWFVAASVIVAMWPTLNNTWVAGVLMVPLWGPLLWLIFAPGQAEPNRFGTPQDAKTSPWEKL